MLKLIIAAAVCLSAAMPSAASPRAQAELRLSPDGRSVIAHVAACRNHVHDALPVCNEERHIPLPELTVDAAKREVRRDGVLVARWSRFGRWLRLEKGWTLRHEASEGKTTVVLERKDA